MSGARIIQLDEAALARVRAHDGIGEIDCARVLEGAAFPGAWRFCDYAVLEPGRSIGTHRHGENEELYLVLEGRGQMNLDGETFDVRPGTIVVNRPGGTHGLVNTSSGTLRIFVVEVEIKSSVATKSDRAPFSALVMAGGRGTRMAESMPETPKPLVTVGGRPLVEWVIRRSLAAGAGHVTLALGHAAERIVSHAASLETEVRARISHLTESEPRGTIGALGDLAAPANETVLVQNGDLFSAIPLRRLIDHHAEGGADLTIAVHTEVHRLTLGEVVSGDDGVVTAYLEKPAKSYRIASGTNVLGPRARALVARGERLDFPDFVRRAIDRGLRVRRFLHAAPWIDVNDGHALRRAEEALAAHRDDFIDFEPGSRA